jgi:ABC-type sugar transport system substrate-binding protein
VLVIVPTSRIGLAQESPIDIVNTAIAECANDQPLTIAASLPHMAFPFFVHMMGQLRAEAEAIGNITLLEFDGEDSIAKQTADVEAAVIQGVDAIIISPKEVAAMAPALQAAIDAGVPVVTIDRRVEGVDGILAHVGADNVIGGEAQGQTIMALFPEGATVFNLQGQPGSGPAIDRNQGLHNVLDPVADQYPIVFEDTAQFRRDQALTVTEAGLAGLDEPPDVIVAANDEMALGALDALAAAGLEDEIVVLGFDALPEALLSIQEGDLEGTVEQFPGGQSRTAMQVAVLHARGCAEPPQPVILIEPIMITSNNFDQAERIGELEG